MDLVVQPARRPLQGVVPLPGDKSVAHRAFLLAGIARGESLVRVRDAGEDVLATLAAMRALGATAEAEARGAWRIRGTGLAGLTAPTAPIDCGNSGTTMRLGAGVLAAQRFSTTLVGDASLTSRPMARVASPLRLRGARIEGRIDPARVGELLPPLVVGPLPAPHVLSATEVTLPIPSAQVKSALLLSGLWSDGVTIVAEPMISRDHTERMLGSLGVPLSRVGSVVALDPAGFSGELPPFELDVPGDPSAAAFVLAAALLVPGSAVGVRGVGLNPTRGGFIHVLRAMGAPVASTFTHDALGEPVGRVEIAHGPLGGAAVGGETTLRAIDEIPILCAVAAAADGVTRIQDARELRVKESDRIAAMCRVLRAFGVACEEQPDGLVIEGRGDRPLRAATIEPGGDHRVAMTAAVLALRAEGECRIQEADCIATSFPRFAGTLRALGADVRATSGD